MKKSKSNDDLNPNFNKPQELRLNFLGKDIPSFHPHALVVNINHRALAKWVFEGITRLDPKGTPVLAGAETIEVSPCKKRYLITLKPNCYSDGTPVFAQDYERAWKKALDPVSKCATVHFLYPIKNAEKAKKGDCPLEAVGVKALDKRTLSIELTHKTPYFLGLLASPAFFPFKESKGTVIGNGPYMLDRWEKGNYLSLKANPFFWDRDDIRIEKINITRVRDANTAFHLYEQGKIDFVGDTISPLPPEALSSAMMRKDSHKRSLLRPYWIYLNSQHFPLSSPLIRRALSGAVERNLITKHILIGSAPLAKPLPEPISSYKGSTKPQDPLTDFEEGLKTLELNRETFSPLVLTFSSDAVTRRLAEYLQERWQKVFGIKVVLKLREFNTLASEMLAGNYEIGGCWSSCEYNDPIALLQRLTFSHHFNKWENPAFKEVINRIKEIGDGDRQSVIREAEEILEVETPVIPIANQCILYLCNPHLKGLAFNQAGVLDLRWAYFE